MPSASIYLVQFALGTALIAAQFPEQASQFAEHIFGHYYGPYSVRPASPTDITYMTEKGCDILNEGVLS